MTKKKFIHILLALVTIIILTSCSNNDKNAEIPQLTISFLDYSNLFKNSISEYNANYKDCRIEAEVYSIDNYDKYVQAVLNDLEKGTAPDIVVIDSLCLDRLGVTDYMNSNMFYDLNELILQDNEFDMSDYNKTILDAGIKEGKRYLLPVSYNVKLLLSTKDNIQKSGIKSTGLDFTWQATQNAISKYYKSSSKPKFFDFLDFSGFCDGLNYNINEYNSGVNNFDFQELQSAIDIYNEIAPFCSSTSGKELTFEKKAKMLVNSSVTMADTDTNLIKGLWTACMSIQKDVEPVILPYPSKEGVTGYPDIMVGISANCRNKKAAYEYIKLLLADKGQAEDFIGIPVNNRAWKERTQIGTGIKDVNGESSLGYIPAELREGLEKIVSHVSTAKIQDKRMNALLQEEVDQLANNKVTTKEIFETLKANMNRNPQLPDTTPANGSGNSDNRGSTDVSDKKELDIYLLDYQRDIIKAVDLYNGEQDNAKIRITAFSNIEEYRSKLATEIMANDGPDIILFMNKDLQSVHKMAATGVFHDLDNFIKNDKNLNLSDFNEKVFNSGIINGKRYMIPLEYSIPIMYTSPDLLSNDGTKLDNIEWTWKGMEYAMKKFTDKDKDKFFFIDIDFRKMLLSSGIKFLDYDKKQAYFDSREFTELLKTYKDIYSNFSMPAEKVEMYGGTDIAAMKKGKLAIGEDGEILNHEELLMMNSFAVSALGKSLELYPFPDMKGEGTVIAYPRSMIAINEKSSNKDICYDFIKSLLTGKFQQECSGGIPVNNRIYYEQLDRLSKDSDIKSFTLMSQGQSIQIQSVPYPQKLKESAENFVKQIRECLFVDEAVYRVIDEELKKYMDGRSTATQAAKNINRKINLYLNE